MSHILGEGRIMLSNIDLTLEAWPCGRKVLGSNPPLCTLEKVSLTSYPGRPTPCERIWEVSRGADET